ncbi:S16 family serine protease [Nitrospira sp. Ecomares 2.1]
MGGCRTSFQSEWADSLTVGPASPQDVSSTVWLFLGGVLLSIFLLLGFSSSSYAASVTDFPIKPVRRAIPILGTTTNAQSEQVGIVAEVQLEFIQRRDHKGLDLQFLNRPGKFSPYAQQSVKDALILVVQAAGLNPDSWTVRFMLPYPGVTLYGESLSAMAALNVVALAKNDPVDEKTVLTGTVTMDGHVGTVGGVPLKILAAHEQRYRRVLIPEEPDVADDDWETPFLMEVSPVGSIKHAYLALTHRPLRSHLNEQPFAATLSQ